MVLCLDMMAMSKLMMKMMRERKVLVDGEPVALQLLDIGQPNPNPTKPTHHAIPKNANIAIHIHYPKAKLCEMAPILLKGMW